MQEGQRQEDGEVPCAPEGEVQRGESEGEEVGRARREEREGRDRR